MHVVHGNSYALIIKGATPQSLEITLCPSNSGITTEAMKMGVSEERWTGLRLQASSISTTPDYHSHMYAKL